MVEGVQQGPVLVGTFFMVAEEYLPRTAAPGTWALMSPARNVYTGFNTVFVPLLLLAAGVGFPAACF